MKQVTVDYEAHSKLPIGSGSATVQPPHCCWGSHQSVAWQKSLCKVWFFPETFVMDTFINASSVLKREPVQGITVFKNTALEKAAEMLPFLIPPGQADSEIRAQTGK